MGSIVTQSLTPPCICTHIGEDLRKRQSNRKWSSRTTVCPHIDNFKTKIPHRLILLFLPTDWVGRNGRIQSPPKYVYRPETWRYRKQSCATWTVSGVGLWSSLFHSSLEVPLSKRYLLFVLPVTTFLRKYEGIFTSTMTITRMTVSFLSAPGKVDNKSY